MSGIRIVAKSEVGQSVMNRIMSADTNRSDWQTSFKERVENDNPYRIVIEHKNRLARSVVKTEYLKEIIVRQLNELGAILGVDYEVTEL